MKRILSLILALIMSLTVLPMSLLATEVTATDETVSPIVEPTTEDLPAEVEVYYQTVTHANPLYHSEPVITSVTEYHDAPLYFARFDEYLSEAEAIEEITEHLKNRETSFYVKVRVDEFDSSTSSSLFYAAMEHTGEPDEGDYLMYQFGQFGAGAEIINYPTVDYANIQFSVIYYADATQEEAVDDKVATVLASLNVNGMSDYEKIKAIYDYICTSVVYDHDNLNNPNYLLKHSAYAALINGKAVCQGYALLFYRLALELGIDCRIVTGYSNNQNHAWNIVKLNGKYYNVDATWDAECYNVLGRYDYFLKSDADFDEHIRDAEHSSESFYASYPMHAESYDVNNAVNIIASGTCGTNLTWVLTDDGTLTISGEGSMSNYNAPWYRYCGSIKTVVIENGVTTIGAKAFLDCTKLTSVSISDSVTSIGSGAFEDCAALESIILPANLTELSVGVFSYCTSLTSISIPDGVCEIASWTFGNCTSLTDVTMSDDVFKIGDNAFYNCTSLKNIKLPDGLVLLGEEAFGSCHSLESVVIPDGVSTISECAFGGCISLTSVTIPEGVDTIGEIAFGRCQSLEYIILPNSLEYIDDSVFLGCTKLKSIAIPENVEYIGDYVFSECDALESIYFLSCDTEIEKLGVSDEVIVYGYDDSTAEDYADRRGSEFVEFCDGDHDYDDWEKLDKNNHIRYCEGFDFAKMEMCSAIETEPHDWNDGVQEDEHTVVYTCVECHAEYKETDVESGNVNGDEAIDKNDAIYLLYSVLFGETAYPLNQECDFNGDGSTDKNDAIYLLYHALFGAESYPLN